MKTFVIEQPVATVAATGFTLTSYAALFFYQVKVHQPNEQRRRGYTSTLIERIIMLFYLQKKTRIATLNRLFSVVALYVGIAKSCEEQATNCKLDS